MKNSLLAITFVITSMALTACKTSKSANQSDALTSMEWELSMIEGVAPASEEFAKGIPTATFTKENKISGNGGCNGYSGTYTVVPQEGLLTLGPIMSTKMFCEGGGEGRYMKALNSVNKYNVERDRLVLMSNSKEVLVFVPKKG